METELRNDKKMYTAIDVNNRLNYLNVQIVKARAVFTAFKESIEDGVCKQNKTSEDYRNIGMDTVRTFELLSVLEDYLVQIESDSQVLEAV